MKSIYQIAIYLSIFTILTGCVREIPNASNFEPQVFISGFLTNGTKHVTVKIQRTVPVDNLSLDPINDAQISLYTKYSSGEINLITSSFDIANGTYRSSEMITTVVGNSYWIEIQLADGTSFKSDEEILKDGVIIKDIEITNELNRVVFADPPDDINFYLINLLFFRNGSLDLETNELTNDVLFNGNDNATFDSTEFLVDNPQEVHVSISNLNFNTYQFYLNQFAQFENQITNAGSEEDPGQLFLPPPANLTGNIMNTSSNTRALGFFGVQSTTQFIKDF
ncbi:DUF4249 family protein [Ulvibacterium marinum]|uniref:DUF4249 family protein n=1 Tax=Ulvibacterium marinum TaxID=2419782 RepID=UPI00249486C5|nr:DUF4249 family protein [Ulvibacterium marinum]